MKISGVGRAASAAIVVVVLMAGCSQAGESATGPPFEPVVDVKQLMQGVIDPAADVVWYSVGTVISSEGIEEIFPKDDEEWTAVRNSAMVLTESGNLLMIGDRPQDQDGWIRLSQELIEASTVALKAAEAKDAAAIFDSGERIYNACRDCHNQYWHEDDPTVIR